MNKKNMNKKIKLSLISTLVISSALITTLPIISCSSSSNVELILDENTMKNVVNIITGLLTTKMEEAENYENQKILASKWSIGEKIDNVINENELNIIKENLNFKYGSKVIKYDDAVKNLTFATETIINEIGTPILGPKLKVNFNDEYTADVSIQINELGKVLPACEGDKKY